MKHRKKLPIAMQLGSILLLALFVAPSAKAQASARASTKDDASETTTAAASCSNPSFAGPGFYPMPVNTTRNGVDNGITKEFDKAWRISGDGINRRESVVLIFRMGDGSYRGKSQGYTNEYDKFTFKWNPAAVAIVHTHPNGSDPRPAEQDRRIADKYGVPNFTLTSTGMYVYDPATKKTSKVLSGLVWLNLSTYQAELKKWLGA